MPTPNRIVGKADGAARRANKRNLHANEGLVLDVLEGADLDVVHAAAQIHLVLTEMSSLNVMLRDGPEKVSIGSFSSYFMSVSGV